jgi:hypothetical protein
MFLFGLLCPRQRITQLVNFALPREGHNGVLLRLLFTASECRLALSYQRPQGGRFLLDRAIFGGNFATSSNGCCSGLCNCWKLTNCETI